MSRFTKKDQVELLKSATTIASIARETLVDIDKAIDRAQQIFDEVETPEYPEHQVAHILELLAIVEEATVECTKAVKAVRFFEALANS